MPFFLGVFENNSNMYEKRQFSNETGIEQQSVVKVTQMRHQYNNYLKVQYFDENSYAGVGNVLRLEFEILGGKHRVWTLHTVGTWQNYLSPIALTLCMQFNWYLWNSGFVLRHKNPGKRALHKTNLVWMGNIDKISAVGEAISVWALETIRDAAHNSLFELQQSLILYQYGSLRSSLRRYMQRSSTSGNKWSRDTYGCKAKIFFQIFVFVKDYPASESVLGVKKNMEKASCTYCTFRHRNRSHASKYYYTTNFTSKNRWFQKSMVRTMEIRSERL